MKWMMKKRSTCELETTEPVMDTPPFQSGASTAHNILLLARMTNTPHMDCWRTTPSTIYQDVGDEKKMYLRIGDNHADSPESGTVSWH